MAPFGKDTNVFDEMGVYWAEIADADQTQRQLKFIKKQLVPKGYDLDLACGTGRHIIHLIESGYQTVGLDISIKLLKIAKQNSKQIALVRGDLRFLPFRTGTFSATISMDTSLGYLPTEREDLQVLFEARRVLVDGGFLVIDVFNRPNLLLKYLGKEPQLKRHEYPSFYLQQERSVSGNGNWLCDVWRINDKRREQERSFQHQVRLYDQATLLAILEEACFSVKRFFGDYEGQQYWADSSRLIAVAAATSG